MDDPTPHRSLKELEQAIDAAKTKHQEKEADASRPPASAGRISVELLSGVVVGVAAGYYLDKWLSTSPIFFFICFFLGVAGSGLNIYKVARRQDIDTHDDDKLN